MSDRLELRHVEHLMDVCGDSHDALMLLGTMAVVATVIKQRDAAEAHAVRAEAELRDIRKLAIESAELNAPDVRAWHRAYPRIITGAPFEELRAIARDYHAEVEAMAATPEMPR